MEAAEAVCRAQPEFSGSALDGIAALVDKSLLRQDRAADREPTSASVRLSAHAEVSVESRFMMLETIREYALERLQASEDWEATRRAHADFFVALAEKAEPQLTGPEQKAWCDQLAKEHDNFRAVFNWVQATGEVNLGLRLGGALWRFWLWHGHVREGYERLNALLALPNAAQHTEERAKALNGAGTVATILCDYRAARAFLQESLEIWRELGDKRGMAIVLNNLAWIACHRGELAAAQSLLEESLAMSRERESQWGIASALCHLGHVALDKGDHARAQVCYHESLTRYQELGNKIGIAEALVGCGRLALAEDRHARAARLFAAAELLRTQAGAPMSVREQERFDREVAALRAALNAEKFDAEYTAGKNMTEEQAVAYAQEGADKV
jgi:tetratricopeptide (TPR) repeat protein